MPRLTKGQIEQIYLLKGEGKTAPEISRELGIPYQAVRYHYDPEVRERMREYYQRHEVRERERDRAWMREYYQRHEVRERMREKGKLQLKERDPEFYYFKELAGFLQQYAEVMEMLRDNSYGCKGCISLFESGAISEALRETYSSLLEGVCSGNYCVDILSYLRKRELGAKSKTIKKDIGIGRGMSGFLRYATDNGLVAKDGKFYILTDYGNALADAIGKRYDIERVLELII